MLDKALTGLAPLASPFIDAFIGNKAEDSYEKFLKSRGMSKADIRRMLSDTAGVEADKAELAKQGIVGNLQSQGLGNSIIGAEASANIDINKNKAINNRMNQLQNLRVQQEMNNAQDLADFRLGRAGAKRQGLADFVGGALGQGGMFLSSWLKRKNEKASTGNEAG